MAAVDFDDKNRRVTSYKRVICNLFGLENLPDTVMSTLMTQNLDFSGEQDLRIGTVTVDRRVSYVDSRCYGNQSRRVACITRCLTISKHHHLCRGDADVVAGRRRVFSSKRAADAAAAGRQLGVVAVVVAAEPVEALIGGRPAVAAARRTGAQRVDEPRLDLAHGVVDVPELVNRWHGQRLQRRWTGSTSAPTVVVVVVVAPVVSSTSFTARHHRMTSNTPQKQASRRRIEMPVPLST